MAMARNFAGFGSSARSNVLTLQYFDLRLAISSILWNAVRQNSLKHEQTCKEPTCHQQAILAQTQDRRSTKKHFNYGTTSGIFVEQPTLSLRVAYRVS